MRSRWDFDAFLRPFWCNVNFPHDYLEGRYVQDDYVEDDYVEDDYVEEVLPSPSLPPSYITPYVSLAR